MKQHLAGGMATIELKATSAICSALAQQAGYSVTTVYVPIEAFFTAAVMRAAICFKTGQRLVGSSTMAILRFVRFC